MTGCLLKHCWPETETMNNIATTWPLSTLQWSDNFIFSQKLQEWSPNTQNCFGNILKMTERRWLFANQERPRIKPIHSAANLQHCENMCLMFLTYSICDGSPKNCMTGIPPLRFNKHILQVWTYTQCVISKFLLVPTASSLATILTFLSDCQIVSLSNLD